ncbi:MAG: hypothetical protein QXW69_02810 [Nitrososphaerota archaeon]
MPKIKQRWKLIPYSFSSQSEVYTSNFIEEKKSMGLIVSIASINV